ncbi:hypothetical protein LO762_24190 [Actinocorallia sp. API 0066]|uniref:hypothetical protein n=1 Tax=Actinocorallia sp. API 0066 TaxID=2896846 RepID=UPI001E442374|nr:hypothetical protein [Actinocorallia sp. API 0066]MCD0452268.1 hypothetical protein [Actinocorallia sp. API 0066]
MDVAVAGGRLPLGVDANGDLTRKGSVCAFLLGTLALFAVLPAGLVGILLSDAGMRRVATDRAAARRLVGWSWIIFAVTDVLVLAGGTAYLLLA